MLRIYLGLTVSLDMGFFSSILIIQVQLWTLLLVADWCSGLHAESILTPGLPITSVSVSDDEESVLSPQPKPSGESCDFETRCPWTSSTNMDGKPHWVQTVVGELTLQVQIHLLEIKPSARSLDDGILLLNTSQSQGDVYVARLLSPLYTASSRTCRLELVLYSPEESIAQKLTVMMQHQKSNLSFALPPLKNVAVTKRSHWKMLTTEIGRMDEPFQISLNYNFSALKTDNFLVLDALHLTNCFDENILPAGAHCSFETGACGWTVNNTTGGGWTYTDSAQMNRGDSAHSPVAEGYFLYLHIESERNDSTASVYSDSIPPVLPNKVCQFTFKFLVHGIFNGSLAVYALEENTLRSSDKLWHTDVTHSDVWSSATLKVPQFKNRFRMQLMATWGWNSFSHIIVDNITFSADCFQSGRIESSSEEQEGSQETDPWEDQNLSPLSEPTYSEEEEDMYWWFTSCGASGPYGPTQAQCNNAYRNTNLSVIVGKDDSLKGVQMWRVPFTKVYTISAYGAAGGKGAKNHNKRSHGIFMSGVFNLQKDELLYILVGQQGEDACPGKNNRTQGICMGESSIIEDEYREKKSLAVWAGGGGGGGGATYVFKEVNGVFTPLLIGAGGGGKAYLEDPEDSSDFEQEEMFERNMEVPGMNGKSGAAGGGGGWSDNTELPWAGKSLLEGSEGGQACYQARATLQWDTYGGFGGGGGPCTSGGGGGGYQGGHTSQLDDISVDGQDGVSFINPSGDMFLQPLAAIENHGEVHIQLFLNCSHCKSGNCRKDIERRVVCLCEVGTMLGSDNITCIGLKGPIPDRQLPLPLILAVLMSTVILGVIFACGSLSFVYHRKKKQLEGARVRLQSTEYKLSKIRSSIIMTDYNPNYCFAGKGAGLSELKEVPRKNITLLRALGHGAFGEVYEGLVVGISGDPNPLQVAIKTLPEICSEQDEMDFLMEALIISKFNHQNIVRCIGVSLQTLPRFILLELMSGGDMKSFLRQNRPWENQPSTLTMSDLLNMARDIACGCKYLEENHFIHRPFFHQRYCSQKLPSDLHQYSTCGQNR
ncbi:leukocyte tyrosine kinase receptor isoform X2 [Mixophyes fleayi]|uniref:leukocyte tyrosine kinase receptor isoform X2 n=1 Tax=Mixophyes fleayi TaxID=3061075 RepID=UPI003F4E2232